jgi:hypothetical protein
MNDVIHTKPVVSVEHIYGLEPAGIVLRITTQDGDAIAYSLRKETVEAVRDMMQAALDHYLPPYPKGQKP